MLKRLEMKGRQLPSKEEIQEYITTAEEMIAEYGWQDIEIHPWTFTSIKATKIINDLKDIDRCSYSSKVYLIQLANGMARELNAQERYEKLPRVKVIILESGEMKEFTEAVANDLVSWGIAKRA